MKRFALFIIAFTILLSLLMILGFNSTPAASAQELKETPIPCNIIGCVDSCPTPTPTMYPPNTLGDEFIKRASGEDEKSGSTELSGYEQVTDFSAVLGANYLETYESGGNGYFETDAVPVGEVWVVTEIQARYSGTSATSFQYIAWGEPGYITIMEILNPVNNVDYYESVNIIMEEGDKLIIFIYGRTTGDQMRLRFSGYKFDIPKATPPAGSWTSETVDIDGENVTLDYTVDLGDIAIVICLLFLAVPIVIYTQFRLVTTYLK